MKKQPIKISAVVLLALFCASMLFLVSCQDAPLQDQQRINGNAMFRGDASHAGAETNNDISFPLRVKWKVYNSSKGIVSTPVVADGLVFFGSFDKNLYALDASSGQIRWKYETGGAVVTSPAVSNGVVYFGSADGSFYALDANTGKKKWSFQAAASPNKIETAIQSSPVINDGIVYFGNNEGRMFALDADKGTKIWEFTTNFKIDESPAISDGMVYFPSNMVLYSIDAKTGNLIWKSQIQNGLGSTPTVDNGMVLYDDDVHLLAYNGNTGDVVWKVSGLGAWGNNPAVKDRVAFYGNQRGFFAVDILTGKQKWENNSTASGTGIPPVFAGGSVYFIDSQANIDAFDLQTGELKGRFKFQADFSPYWAVPTSMTIANGVIYLGSMDGNIYAIQGATTG